MSLELAKGRTGVFNNAWNTVHKTTVTTVTTCKTTVTTSDPSHKK